TRAICCSVKGRTSRRQMVMTPTRFVSRRSETASFSPMVRAGPQQAVLDALVQSAAHLCDAECALIFRLQEGTYHLAASHGFSDEVREWVACNPIPPGRSTLVERTALTARTVHLPDCLADPEYTYAESQKRGGYRTMLGVPLLRDGTPLGVIALTRSQV